MQLHELEWQDDEKWQDTYCLILLQGHDKHIDIRPLHIGGGYRIYLEKGYDLIPHSGGALQVWEHLDPLAAQCVLHHLLQEYSAIEELPIE
jgi:hypothetical protein